VIIRGGQFVERFEDFFKRHRPLVRDERERRHALQGDRCHDAERAQPHPHRVEQLRPVDSRTRGHRPVGQHQFEADRLGGEAA
jgi:hypothetical protein